MEGLSTRGRYATRIMLQLAIQGGTEPVRIQRISEEEGIPQQYVEQLLIRLKGAGLVKSRRGSKGGYVLACDPQKVTVADILQVMEGTIALAPCQNEHCARQTQCITRSIWRQASEAMNHVFATTTLQAMARQSGQLRPIGDYSI